MLGPDTAEEIWEGVNEQLKSPVFSSQGLINRFKVQTLCTTDDPVQTTKYHQAIASDEKIQFQVLPTFRPDKSWAVQKPDDFSAWVKELETCTEKTISCLTDYLEALAKRMNHFHDLGSRLSDHAFEQCFAEFPSEQDATAIFTNTLKERFHPPKKPKNSVPS